MSKNTELIDAILTIISNKPDEVHHITSNEIVVDGYSEEEISNQLDFLYTMKFIDAKKRTSGNNLAFWIVYGLTSLGRELARK